MKLKVCSASRFKYVLSPGSDLKLKVCSESRLKYKAESVL